MRHPLPEVQEDRDWWLLARDAVWGGLESSGNVVGGTGCPQATPSLPPSQGGDWADSNAICPGSGIRRGCVK